MKLLRKHSPAFTIVELLIVIVVIGILAAITIVAYNGIQNRARVSAASSALTQAAKKITIAMNDGTLSSFPNSQAEFDALGLSTQNVNYQYSTLITNSTVTGYCITATVGPTSYKITNTSSPEPTSCAGHGTGGQSAVTNLEVNPSSETAVMNSAGGGTGTRTQSTTQKVSGNNSTRFVWASGSAGVQTNIVTVLPNKTYTVALSIFVESGALPQFYVAASDYSTNTQVFPAVGGLGQWYRISRTYTTTASQTTMRAWTTVGAASTFYADAVMITEGSTQYTYADGSSNNWVWNGTAHNATSTGPPLP